MAFGRFQLGQSIMALACLGAGVQLLLKANVLGWAGMPLFVAIIVILMAVAVGGTFLPDPRLAWVPTTLSVFLAVLAGLSSGFLLPAAALLLIGMVVLSVRREPGPA